MIRDKSKQYLQFPCVLRKKLQSKELQIPMDAEYKYEKIWGYRCIVRTKEDNTPVNREDFFRILKI